ncbi:hypothetical protein GCM10009664_16900 [Kitasatospora gansuensis]
MLNMPISYHTWAFHVAFWVQITSGPHDCGPPSGTAGRASRGAAQGVRPPEAGFSWTQPAVLGAPSSFSRKSM